jgi:hypothetical protein
MHSQGSSKDMMKYSKKPLLFHNVMQFHEEIIFQKYFKKVMSLTQAIRKRLALKQTTKSRLVFLPKRHKTVKE